MNVAGTPGSGWTRKRVPCGAVACAGVAGVASAAAAMTARSAVWWARARATPDCCRASTTTSGTRARWRMRQGTPGPPPSPQRGGLPASASWRPSSCGGPSDHEPNGCRRQGATGREPYTSRGPQLDAETDGDAVGASDGWRAVGGVTLTHQRAGSTSPSGGSDGIHRPAWEYQRHHLTASPPRPGPRATPGAPGMLSAATSARCSSSPRTSSGPSGSCIEALVIPGPSGPLRLFAQTGGCWGSGDRGPESPLALVHYCR